MNRRKAISFILGLFGTSSVPAIAQVDDPNKIDYERYGRLLVEEILSSKRCEFTTDWDGYHAEYMRWHKSATNLFEVRREIIEKLL